MKWINYLRLSMLISLIFVSPSYAAEKIQETVLGMNVTGTKDLPNVLYIVPWKDSTSAIAPPEVRRLVDEIYAPIDPDVFNKQVAFYYQLTDVNPVKGDTASEN